MQVSFQPQIAAKHLEKLSPWVTLVTKQVQFSQNGPLETYHSFLQGDYIAILAQTPSGHFPIVRQFRPAVERFTWELPAGTLEPDEDPEACCRRELLEETGFTAGEVILLGRGCPDTGRAEQSQYTFYVRTTSNQVASLKEDDAVKEVRLVRLAELKALIQAGEFCHELHISALARAVFFLDDFFYGG